MRFNVKSSLVSAFVVAAVALPGPVLAEDGKSRLLATDLVKLMAERHLEGYAIEDPARPGYFIAVRAYPGVQLLLVEARSTAPDYLRAQIAQQAYHAKFGTAESQYAEMVTILLDHLKSATSSH